MTITTTRISRKAPTPTPTPMPMSLLRLSLRDPTVGTEIENSSEANNYIVYYGGREGPFKSVDLQFL